jgi:YesN/AraC family two-component response regulator
MKENENVTHVKKSSLVAENVLHYLNVNYSMKINSKMIEEKFEVNFDYLNRIFNAITGETIFQYLTKVRINQAEELIRTTNLPFGEIGYLVGIEDQFYFSKLFKKVTGLTPTGYYHNFHQC